jgi:hypothetical protein
LLPEHVFQSIRYSFAIKPHSLELMAKEAARKEVDERPEEQT